MSSVTAKEIADESQPPAQPAMDPSRALSDRAHALTQNGRFAEALALVSRELARRPGDNELLFARASTLFDWGRLREAMETFVEAQSAGFSRTALYLNLAWASHLCRRSEDAERYARQAVATDPRSSAAHVGLATALQRLKRYPEAIAAYEAALDLTPDFANCAAGIAYCKLEENHYVEAERWLRKAIDLGPDPQLWTSLGVVLANMKRFDEAADAFRRAAAIEAARGLPPESALGQAFALMLEGRADEVAELTRRHLPTLPDPRLHSHYAFSLLTLGEMREGWEQYEVRWLQEPHLSHRLACGKPVWAGQRLEGKTVLLRVEQGAGDVVQFARYATLLKARGARVVLEVRPELVRLARGFEGIDAVFAPPSPAPEFDYYVHVMGLPRAFGTDAATIPARVPYLSVDPDDWQAWAERIGVRGFRVGLAWAGNPKHANDAYRSMSLAELHPLFDVHGVRFHSLQKAPKQGELESLPQVANLIDLDAHLVDFAATAAAISHMDLVICVDTAVAHMAGAMGKPVWLLLPRIGDFRWSQEGAHSPWYPTMRLFRQSEQGEWGDVVARVKAALEDAAQSGVVTVPLATTTAPAHRAVARGDGTIARVIESRHGIVQYFPDLDDAARSIAWYGEFLEPQVRLLTGLLQRGAHVLEAGAGIGAHALPLARRIGAEGHLLLYESRPLVQRVLAQNVDVNRLGHGVTVMRRPLSRPQQAGDAFDTIDGLLLRRLDLVKIGPDVDAGGILAGAAETLWRLRPLLFIAAPDLGGVHELARRAAGFGYRCWQIRAPLFSTNNFNRREEDIFDGREAWALLAIAEELDAKIDVPGAVEIRADATCNLSADKTPPAARSVVQKLRKWLQ